MAWAGRRVSTQRLLRNWAIVYCGNFVGALATAGVLFAGKQYEFGGGAVGVQARTIAAAKTNLGSVQAIALGALCNALVCLAVWLCYSARTTTDKILSILPPIAAFVAAGFEHSVANMFFIPMGLLVLAGNLLPVTTGDVIGGAVMVGTVCWFVYLRSTPSA